MDRFDNLTDREKERLAEFAREAIYLTEEENEAIEHQIPMTQEIFEQCSALCRNKSDVSFDLLDRRISRIC